VATRENIILITYLDSPRTDIEERHEGLGLRRETEQKGGGGEENKTYFFS